MSELLWCEECQSRHTKEFGDEFHGRLLAPRCMTRYELEMQHGAPVAKEHESGGWVRYEDLEALRSELAECRDHLSSVIAQPDRPTIKAAADWLANWDGERL